MNREIALEILKAYGRPAFEVGETTITFSRQNLSDIEVIESMPTDELVKHWKSLVWMNYIYSQVSLNEMQRIDLIELEFKDREIHEDLNVWYENAATEFELNNQL